MTEDYFSLQDSKFLGCLSRQEVTTTYDVFVSHSSHDAELADRFEKWVSQLLSVRCFRAPYDIGLGSAWNSELLAALDNSTAGVILLTPNSLKSHWVHAEIGALLSRPNCLVIPLYFPPLNKSRPFSLVQFQQGEDWANDDSRLKLATILAGRFGKSVRGTDSIINPGFGLTASSEFLAWSTSEECLAVLSQRFAGSDESAAVKAFDGSSKAEDFLIKYLLRYHWRSYEQAVYDATNSGRRSIPLPNTPRMEAARELVANATLTIEAISVHRVDTWWKKGNYDSYLQANMDASRDRHIQIRRIVIVKSQVDLTHAETDKSIARQKQAGIDLRWCDDADFERFTGRVPKNLLIVDGRFMTRAYEGETDGELVLSPSHIATEHERFELLWARLADHSLK